MKTNNETASYIIGNMMTPAGPVPLTTSRWSLHDRWGEIRVRLGIGRSRYSVLPGLYALGNPDKQSVILVTANYKLTFDKLRKELGGLDAWILVLDTDGINVWCAAGKGSFGTEELVRRIGSSGLTKIAAHREIILPQLGAAGVSAHTVKLRSRFTVRFGPVRAADIREYLRNGKTAVPGMRRVRFSLKDRAELIPIEIIYGLPKLLIFSFVYFMAAGLNKDGYSLSMIAANGPPAVQLLVLAFLAGTVIGPLFLPWIPGRSFAVKGGIAGLILLPLLFLFFHSERDWLTLLPWVMIIPAISSFLTLNFTGSSTFTSLSGVKKEMRIALPIQIGSFVSGSVFWIAIRFIRGGT